MSTKTKRVSLRAVQWGVLASFCLHNLEEVLTMRAQRGELSALMAKVPWQAARRELPSVEVFSMAVGAATLIGIVITWLSTREPETSWKSYLFCAFVATVLLNVFAPHVAATLVLGSYTPGVITAVFCNLPLCIAYLLRVRHRQSVSRLGLASVLLAAPLTMGGSLLLISFLANAVLEAR